MYSLIYIHKRCWITNDATDILHDIIKTLVRQASRWSSAAEQDESPLVSVLHANYGAGYLWALKDIATSEQINQATGVDVLRFEKEITRIQDNATKKALQVCPDYNPKTNSYLASLAGE